MIFLTRYPEAVIYSTNFQKWGDEGDLKTAKWMFGRVKKTEFICTRAYLV